MRVICNPKALTIASILTSLFLEPSVGLAQTIVTPKFLYDRSGEARIGRIYLYCTAIGSSLNRAHYTMKAFGSVSFLQTRVQYFVNNIMLYPDLRFVPPGNIIDGLPQTFNKSSAIVQVTGIATGYTLDRNSFIVYKIPNDVIVQCPQLEDPCLSKESNCSSPDEPSPPPSPGTCFTSSVYWHEVPCSTSAAPTGTDEVSKMSWGFGIGSDYLS